jgi:hypothetical protein
MTTKHTPTPWRDCAPPSNFHKGKIFIRPANGERLIAIVSGEMQQDEIRANAAFIVRAVNTHDDLVEALKDLLDGTGDMTAERIEKARAALRKGEGGVAGAGLGMKMS